MDNEAQRKEQSAETNRQKMVTQQGSTVVVVECLDNIQHGAGEKIQGRIQLIANEDGSISFREVPVEESVEDYVMRALDNLENVCENIDELARRAEELSTNANKFIKPPVQVKPKRVYNVANLNGFALVALVSKLSDMTSTSENREQFNKYMDSLKKWGGIISV